MVSILNTEVREGLKEWVMVEQRLQDGQNEAMWISEGKAFQAKRTASKKNLNQWFPTYHSQEASKTKTSLISVFYNETWQQFDRV